MDEEPRGLGGWLIIPLIGLIIALVKMLLALFQIYLPIFQDGTWSIITNAESEYYHPLWGPLVISEMVINIGLVIFCGYLLYLFFTKQRLFPKFFIIYMIINVVFLISDTYVASLIPSVAEQRSNGIDPDLGRAVIGAAIWIPYFLLSKRVKNTFVEPLPEDQLDDDNDGIAFQRSTLS